MKRTLILILVISVLFLPLHQVSAVIEQNELEWGTGTSIRLSGEIVSDKLTDDFHPLGITVTLLSLNESVVEIYNIRVDYRISTHFSGYTPMSRLSVINSSSQTTVFFQYDALWGNCSLEMKISLFSNYTLGEDPTFVTDWVVYFNIEPYVEPTTPSVTETPTNTTPTQDGFDWGENWYIFLIVGGGILVILVLIRVGTSLNHKRKMRKLE